AVRREHDYPPQEDRHHDSDDGQEELQLRAHSESLMPSVGETSTVRPPRLPTTSTWVCFGMMASRSAARARKRSVPWRTSIITSPRCPGVMSAVTLASFPTTSSATFPSSAIGPRGLVVKHSPAAGGRNRGGAAAHRRP